MYSIYILMNVLLSLKEQKVDSEVYFYMKNMKIYTSTILSFFNEHTALQAYSCSWLVFSVLSFK